MILLLLINLLLDGTCSKTIDSQYAFSEEFFQTVKEAHTSQAGLLFSFNMTVYNVSQLIDLSDNDQLKSVVDNQLNELQTDFESNNHSVHRDTLNTVHRKHYKTIHGDVRQTIFGDLVNQIVYGNVNQKIFGGHIYQIVHGTIYQTIYGGNVNQIVYDDVYQEIFGGNITGIIYGNVTQTTHGGKVHQTIHGKISDNIHAEHVNETVEKELRQTADSQTVHQNDIPESFDARHVWPRCKNIGKVYDEGACSSSYAFAVVPAFSDRRCILSKGKYKDLLSIEYLLSCCRDCKLNDSTKTCGSGEPTTAWWFLHKRGIISGGDYESKHGCQPLSLVPCKRRIFNGHDYFCEGQNAPELRCHSRCTNKDYGVPYNKDKHHADMQYYVDSKVTSIQQEIMTNGPVVAQITLYEDFVHYKSGVYQHTSEKRYNHMHTAKLIGWGKENGVPYWLLVNSWGEKWGDKGTFKILRGTHECNLEYYVSAAIPKMD